VLNPFRIKPEKPAIIQPYLQRYLNKSNQQHIKIKFSPVIFVPTGFSAFFIYFFNFSHIIPIVLQKFSSPIKNAENLDAK